MRVLMQSELNEWLDRLGQGPQVVAPVSVEGHILFRSIRTHADVAWGFERTEISPKSFTFPATEAILSIEQGSETVIRDAEPPPPTVIFGIRPCDARGALAIDALFLGQEPADGRYAQNREATTMVGLACPQMWDTCFCTVVGGSPNGKDGLDLLLTELDPGEPNTRYTVQVISAKGEALVATMGGVEQDASPPAPKLADDLPELRNSADWIRLFNDVYWRHLADRCLGCRVCTFVCPTCRCFDVRDEVVRRRLGQTVYRRLRAWDACTSEPYRRIAGGHNPRPTPHSRLRNRFFCKLAYYPDDFGPLGCVGCGRCIEACPVNIDILEVIADVARLAASRAEEAK